MESDWTPLMGDGNGVEEGYGAEGGGANNAASASATLDAWDQQEEEKLNAIENELAALDPEASPAIYEYLTKQIEKRKSKTNPEYVRTKKGKVQLVQKLFVNVDEAPEDNWVGKILGHKGKFFREIAATANVKLAIQGRGSSKIDDLAEEEKLIDGTSQNEHLKEPLHVRIESHTYPSRAWRNMQWAIDMLVPHLTTNPSAEVTANAEAALEAANEKAMQRRSLQDPYYAGYPPVAKPVIGAPRPPRYNPYTAAMAADPYDPYAIGHSLASGRYGAGKVHDPNRGRGFGRGAPRGRARSRPY